MEVSATERFSRDIRGGGGASTAAYVPVSPRSPIDDIVSAALDAASLGQRGRTTVHIPTLCIDSIFITRARGSARIIDVLYALSDRVHGQKCIRDSFVGCELPPPRRIRR